VVREAAGVACILLLRKRGLLIKGWVCVERESRRE
jgi:hypothetical protein